MHGAPSRPTRLGRSMACAALALALLGGATAGAQETKIAVIDVGVILEESVAGKAALEVVRNAQEQKVAEIQSKDAEAKAIQDQISAGQLTLSEERLAELKKGLEDKVIELQRMQADAQRELEKVRADSLQKIEEKIMPLINEIGAEGEYTLIFNKFQAGLVFAKESSDITQEVLARFNAKMSEEEAGQQ